MHININNAIITILLLGFLAFSTCSAKAQELPNANMNFRVCVSMADMSRYLEEKNNEQLTFQGPSVDGGLTSFFMSPKGETWTITYTFSTREGKTCVIENGTNWEIRYDNHRRTNAY